MSDSNIEIVTMEDCIEKMLYDHENGLEKGSSTHIDMIDRCWKWRRGEVSLHTGYQNEGKSLCIRYLSIIKSLVDGWKHAFSAPEDYPAYMFFDDMIHTYTGQSTDRDNMNYVSRENYIKAYEKLKNYFYFVYIKPPHNYLEKVLEGFEDLVTKYGIDSCVIDPIIKFSRSPDAPERDDLYAAYTTTMLTDFARRTNTCTHLVMHQVTPKPMDNGLYPKPSAYAIKGGGTWSDGVDNVLFVQRPNYNKDKQDTLVTFGSQKIKRHKLVAIPQEYSMRFDRRTNRYTTEEGAPLFNFDKYLI